MVAEAEELPTISDDLVVTKYKMAAEIVNSEWRLEMNVRLKEHMYCRGLEGAV